MGFIQVIVILNNYTVSTLKGEQHESCEFSFLWGKMRTIAQETASQLVLRNCQRGRGKVSICDLGEGEEHAIKHFFLFFAEGFC